jgi:hypothetical protein
MKKNEHTYFNRSLGKRLANLGTFLTILSLIIDIVKITWVTRCFSYHCIIFISLLTLFLLHLIIRFVFIPIIVIFNICIIHIGIFICLMNMLLSTAWVLTLVIVCYLVLIKIILLLITGLWKILPFHSLWLLF